MKLRCVMDELAMGAIKYSKDGRSASSHHFAYKFADYPNLLFKCSISICDRDYAICSYKDGSPLLEVNAFFASILKLQQYFRFVLSNAKLRQLSLYNL